MLGLSSISNTVPTAAESVAVAGGDATAIQKFEDQMREAIQSAEGKKLREATAQFVSTAFLMPMLKQVREDPFKSDLFHGGQGEEVFGAQLDQKMADNIATSANFPLVDHLFTHFARQLNLQSKVDVRG
jgi:Rod binding domain-containing protein